MSSPVMVSSQPTSPVQPVSSSPRVPPGEGDGEGDVDMSDDDGNFMQMSTGSNVINEIGNDFGVPKAPRPF